MIDFEKFDEDQIVTFILRQNCPFRLFDAVLPQINNRSELFASQPVKNAICKKIQTENWKMVEVTFLLKKYLLGGLPLSTLSKIAWVKKL